MTFPIEPGEILAGKYRVDKILGTGGMGYVVACHHIHLQQNVALKFLHSTMLDNEEVIGRFLREAQSAARIKSEHVVRVSDVGTLENGTPYMVMEYLDGVDLRQTLDKSGPLAVSTAVDYLLQACEALAEAHVLGIVHRDLKPNNLFLTRKPDGRACVKILDFGISKISASTPGIGNLTRTADTLGTPSYMAPEQLTSTRSVDVRADIWALGVVLYELVSGTLPFHGETLAELCIHIVQNEPRTLSAANLTPVPALWEVIKQCLRKNRDERFNNVAEVAAALAPFGTENAQLSLDTISRIIPRESTSKTMHSLKASATLAQRDNTETMGEVSWGNTSSARARSSRLPLLIGLGVIATVGVLTLGWLIRTLSGGTPVASSAPVTPPRYAGSSSAKVGPAPVGCVTPVTGTSVAPVATGTPTVQATPDASSSASITTKRAEAIEPARATPGATARPKAAQSQRRTPSDAESLIEDRR